MGLTMGCCRCHDHKFDPMPQADYYRLLSFFRNMRRYENPNYTENSPTAVPLANPEMAKRWFAQRKAQTKPLEEKLQQTKDAKGKEAAGARNQAAVDGRLAAVCLDLGRERGGQQGTAHARVDSRQCRHARRQKFNQPS